MSTSPPLLGNSESSKKYGNCLDGSHMNSSMITRPNESAYSASFFSEMRKIHFSNSSSPAMSHGYSLKAPSERTCALTVANL